ncbi:uncharacterized protein UTRI_02562 [Ustilago trichophora]|uniref:Uncharacterized protein n=1 Tax=Ustilago trichophora TaxID=86804 RepID=A0A5C3E9P8_9BASI|nr:uncharacterized protein UTRI_02562 [Ustilago trichophora]
MRSMPNLAIKQALSAARPVTARLGLTARTCSKRSFSSSGVKQVINRPEITPLFLFTGGIIGLALFFGGRHLFKDKELRIDHAHANRLATKTENLDFDAMAKVAEDPEGKLTKGAIEEEKRRDQRKEDIKREKEEKAKNKL